MNFSDQRHSKLADSILLELERISGEFSLFQQSANLSCISGCGRCCFKSDIYCNPYELLPMALELLRNGEAQNVYERLSEIKKDQCVFLNVTNAEKFEGNCTQYKFRPLVCRTFGVSARHEKNEAVSFSVCRPLKEVKAQAFMNLTKDSPNLAFIDFCKNRLGAIDPMLFEEEFPMHESMKRILEKVLLYSSYN